MVSEITKIQFGILSDEDILKQSVCQIYKPSLLIEEGSVYDPRLGCVENNKTCITCEEDIWKCTGHFGHINLNVPIILYYKQVATMLKLFCFQCSRLLCTQDELNLHNLKTYDNIIYYISNKISFCGRCTNPHPEIRFDIGETNIIAHLKFRNEKTTRTMQPSDIKRIFDLIPDEDVSILRIDYTLFHPKNLVITKFPVIPTCCRPRMETPDNTSDDDLSISLVDIIKYNDILGKVNISLTVFEKTVNELKFKTLTYCDNSKGKAIHNTNHKPMTGIKERITKKTGHVRQNLMGKRCDRTARTVVGPDPTLKLNEVGIPEEFGKTLTIPVHVNTFTLDKLTQLVNTPGKATTIIKQNGERIDILKVINKPGTHLRHGDLIVRSLPPSGLRPPRLRAARAGESRSCGSPVIERITVTNCKMKLYENDKIYRIKDEKEKLIPTILPHTKKLELEIGDKVERYIQTGDYVLVNRQPTLHRNSMQGMKMVLKPGKTMRFNLAIVDKFNMDFDGDEGNIFIQETLEANAELQYLSNAKYNTKSLQKNKPEMVIIQDNLTGSYLMTPKERQMMSRGDFMQCLMRVNHNYDYIKRLQEIQELRNEKGYTSQGLFGFIFPSDFDVEYPQYNFKITKGVLVTGTFNSMILNKTEKGILYLIADEYDADINATVIDNFLYLTNAWLEINPFSIGIQDCLIENKDKQTEINNVIHKYFLEATNVAESTEHKLIKESRINCALNKAKDLGLKIAKNALTPDNNFISTVTSGSKGDYFNIAQITGLLGQQNLSGLRPSPTLDGDRRTLVHYPRIILNDPARKYRSRGFVASSFINGMKPDELFFHAMTGREGMTKTAMGTATSGYIQRSIVKLNEDLKIGYDGTVRDANQNIYQYVFGNHGFDPCKVTFTKKGCQPINIQRFANQLKNKILNPNLKKLTEKQIESILLNCTFKPPIPNEIWKPIHIKEQFFLKEQLEDIVLDQTQFNIFSDHIITKYHTSRITPGEAVGIIGAQSIGERQTQTTLNTFHTAGKLQQSSVGRLDEILNMTKKLKNKTCSLFFIEKYKTSDALRKAIGSSIKYLCFGDVIYNEPIIEFINNYTTIKFDLIPKKLFDNRINPYQIATIILKELNSLPNLTCSVESLGIKINFLDTEKTGIDITSLQNILICGMEGVTEIYLDFVDNEWCIITEGSNLLKMLAHPLIDNNRIYCNDFWEVYDCLGIGAVREMLFKDLKNVIHGVNSLHIQLLVDKMTFKGKPSSITRYTMRSNDVGPLSKATFEESADILLAAAMRTETDKTTGISAAIICGNQPRIGTGMMDLKIDYTKLENSKTQISEQTLKPKIQNNETSDFIEPEIYY